MKNVSWGWKFVAGAVAVVAIAALVPAVYGAQRVAHAEEVRTRCVKRFGAVRSWKARITASETDSAGKTSVLHEQLSVRAPGEYRIGISEQDEHGRPVTSTTIRTGTEMSTWRTNADGTTELHVRTGVRPTLGVDLDTLLGQTVEAIADAPALRIAGRGRRNGRPADKLDLGEGRFVWVDEESGLPVEEQIVSGDDVVHSVTFDDVVTDVAIGDEEFDVRALGTPDTTSVEDLGFREVARPAGVAAVLGFTPLAVASPDGYALETQGYTDPHISDGETQSEASFVSAFSNGTEAVLVTQISRPGLSVDDVASASGDDGAIRQLGVGDSRAVLFGRGVPSRLVLVRRGVLVTIEGGRSEAELMALARGIR